MSSSVKSTRGHWQIGNDRMVLDCQLGTAGWQLNMAAVDSASKLRTWHTCLPADLPPDQCTMVWQDVHGQKIVGRDQIMGMGHFRQHLTSCCVRFIATEDSHSFEFDYAWRFSQPVENVALYFVSSRSSDPVVQSAIGQEASSATNRDWKITADRVRDVNHIELEGCDSTAQIVVHSIRPQWADSNSEQLFDARWLQIFARVPLARKFPQTVQWRVAFTTNLPLPETTQY